MYENKLYFYSQIVPATLPIEQRTRAGRFILIDLFHFRNHLFNKRFHFWNIILDCFP